MVDYVEILLELRREDERYAVDVRLSNIEADLVRSTGEARFDFEGLRSCGDDWNAYGRLLWKCLFAEERTESYLERGYDAAKWLKVPLHLRLSIDPTASELHGLRWEVLRNPDTDQLLATRENLLFARYVVSQDFRPVDLRSRDAQRALVVIASPANIGDLHPDGRSLPPLDVKGEVDRARGSLNDIPILILDSGGKATLNNIISKLREGYDIFYLVCHGAQINGEPKIYLEGVDGNADVVAGADMATRISELQQRPRLVVLASCQSAGSGETCCSSDGGLLTALGPRFADTGIPAVIAMQGNITMRTVAEFMPVFFQELKRHGQIDLAMAIARGVVRKFDDWWVPVLFTSLKTATIGWYDPGFTGEQPGFTCWPAIINSIQQGRCTPILGSGMLESLTGSFGSMARQWAETYHYPMGGHERSQLPLVAQYLTVDQDEPFLRNLFSQELKKGVLQHYGHDLNSDVHNAPLDQLISAAGVVRRQLEATEPYDALARLDLPVYVSTNPDNLLVDALTAAGKKPHVVLCPRGDFDLENAKDGGDYTPTPEEPLVYYLFGHLRDVYSVVLTQDDYFDYLIDVTKNNDLIPPIVREHLANSALLFLGFQISDWDFRVFFRSIMNQEGRGLRRRYKHVAVQIDPLHAHCLDVDRARHYLEHYFSSTEINIYWGSAEDFLKELVRRKEVQ